MLWVKDYKRELDYQSTRKDIDSTKFAHVGYSWGAATWAASFPPSSRASGRACCTWRDSRWSAAGPEVDPFNYLPRVKSPVLMLNGKYDFFFPSATAQEPFFKRLGTPAADKKYILYEGGHDVPRTELIKESLAWLDKYLGPVR